MLAEEGLKGAAEGKRRVCFVGEESKVGGGMSGGDGAAGFAETQTFLTAMGWLWGALLGRAEIQQYCLVLCGSCVPSRP